ncbi:HNH endonuclease [Vibrio parahaemolyticus]|uniref:HNH endonuclease n=1 Tax=Vibrio parahaemolyticus TaxID=670 RepID=UPI00356B74C2
MLKSAQMGFVKVAEVSHPGPYLEVHHLTRLADGGADCPENVIALCPTCHRRAHYSIDNQEFNEKLLKIALSIEEKIA